jgi:hypothetical protein
MENDGLALWGLIRRRSGFSKAMMWLGSAKSQIRTSKDCLIQTPKSRNMKGLTTNIIATRRYGSILAIKDEFFKRFAIHQVIGLCRRGNELDLPRLNAL